MDGLGHYSRPTYQAEGCPKISLVVNSPSHHNASHSSSQHSMTAPHLHLTSFGRQGSGSGSVSTPETEYSQATDTIGSLERDDDKSSDHLDHANNQEDDGPPPPIADRPERTKSIVSFIRCILI